MADATPAARRRPTTPRRKPAGSRSDLDALAVTALIAALAAAGARIATPFEHGIWLVAYLSLVGSAAPFLLARGEAALLAHGAASAAGPATRHAELLLWLAGVIAVPLGVFVEARLLVVIGAIALLGALASLARLVRGTKPATDETAAAAASDAAEPAPGETAPRLRAAYAALLAFLAASTAVGTALAWDLPWL